jgi:hypothetical protein
MSDPLLTPLLEANNGRPAPIIRERDSSESMGSSRAISPIGNLVLCGISLSNMAWNHDPTALGQPCVTLRSPK